MLPPRLSKTIKVGEEIKALTADDYETYLQMVGSNRKVLVSAYIDGRLQDNEMKFETDNDEQRVKNLNDLYQLSLKLGKKEFLQSKGWEIEDEEEKEDLDELYIDETEYERTTPRTKSELRAEDNN